MNKKSCKRIIGLFIFSFTIALLSIINASAEEKICDKVDNVTLLERYGFEVDYIETEDVKKYVVLSEFNAADAKKLFNSFDTSKIKFKIKELYFYKPYELPVDAQGKPIASNITDADNIKNLDTNYVEKYSGSLDDLVKSGMIKTLSLGASDSIDVSTSIFDKRNDTDKIGIAFKIVPDGFNDPEVKEKCGEKSTFYAIVHVAYEIGEDEEPETAEAGAETVEDDIIDVNNNQSESLNCSGYENIKDKNSFAYNFCADKAASVGISGNEKKAGTKKFDIVKENKIIVKYEESDKQKKNPYKPGNAFSYKCDYTVNNTSGTVSSDSSEYYVNKNYLYGKGTITYSEDYVYHGEYSKPKKLTASCEIKCEEVVKVEYGPPVASKAGFCFEYKVKVTSRVNCEGTLPNAPPSQKVCTPTPSCKHSNGKVWPIAGPDEKFDECVTSCDGGVYSDRCVNKCYKKVYGESIVRQTTGTEIAYDDNATGTSNSAVTIKYNIPYSYVVVGKDIIWKVNSTARKTKYAGGTYKSWNRVLNTDSYWHRRHKWGIITSTYSRYTDEGIPAKKGCDSDCKWKQNTSGDCGSDEYLRYYNHPNIYKKSYTDKKTKLTHTRADDNDYSYDPNDPNKNKNIYDRYSYDRYQNQQIYKNLVTKCKAYAACNTTTAEFTISVSYTEKGKESTVKTINFPYTDNNDKNSKDIIKHNESNDSVTCPTSNNSIILKSAGCYNCGGVGFDISENEGKDGLKKKYMTEWSFPGTWWDLKTQRISYKPVNDKTWMEIDEKFCLPLNAGNVNTAWYNYYQYKTKGEKPDESYSYYNSEYMTNIQCPDGRKVTDTCRTKHSNFTANDAKSVTEGGKIDYNIKATARKFGLFEWDIDIECFYAVSDIFPKEKETDTCEATCEPSEKYRVRSVDLNNLFPATKGESETRTPGFNWSKYANQTEKDKNLISTPANYAKWIERTAKNGGIYNDEYLDYEVTLTKEIISEIKKTANKDYTRWDGDIINSNGESSVNNYRSPLFKDGGLLAGGKSVYPNGTALKCNNIGEKDSISAGYGAKCASFTDDEKEGK